MAVKEAASALEEELGEDGELTFGKMSCKGSGRNQFTCKTRGTLTPFSEDDGDELGDDDESETQAADPSQGDGSAEDEDAEYGKFKATIKVRAVRGASGAPSVRVKLRVKFFNTNK
jgi:hypothetical protein